MILGTFDVITDLGNLGTFWSYFRDFRIQNHCYKTFCQIRKHLNASCLNGCKACRAQHVLRFVHLQFPLTMDPCDTDKDPTKIAQKDPMCGGNRDFVPPDRRLLKKFKFLTFIS